MEPMVGIEPTTDGLRNRCSTTELHWLNSLKNKRFRLPFKEQCLSQATPECQNFKRGSFAAKRQQTNVRYNLLRRLERKNALRLTATQPHFLQHDNGVHLYFFLIACRQSNADAFVFLALAGAFAIARTTGPDLYHNWHFPFGGFEQWLLELLAIIGILASALWAIGIIFIIQRVRD
jgi:hypothetical protein